jgi:hypothetical protein
MKVTFFSGVALAAIAAEKAQAASPLESVAAEVDDNQLAQIKAAEISPRSLAQVSDDTQDSSAGGDLAEI